MIFSDDASVLGEKSGVYFLKYLLREERKGRGIVSMHFPYTQESRFVEGDVLHILIIEQSYSLALKCADIVL